MGNRSCSNHAGRVILPDGSIREFHEPLTVAELMLEHPQQVVVEFSYNYNPSSHPERLARPTPLPADKKLEVNKIYLMLPWRRGRLRSISSQNARQILLSINTILRAQSLLPSSSSSRTLQIFAKIRPLNTAEHDKFVVPRKDLEAEEEEEGGTLQISVGSRECMTRQVSGKGWKPSLDTIKENKERRKELNLVFLASKVGKRIETKGLVWG